MREDGAGREPSVQTPGGEERVESPSVWLVPGWERGEGVWLGLETQVGPCGSC